MKLPTKAVIAAAGLGTRFLPQTKAMPKEMLPIVDKPVIQIIVEQLVEAGVTDIIIVTGSTKRAIEDHFDRSDELEHELRAKGKDDFADQIKDIAELANFIYVRQKGTPKGTARPVLNAKHLIGDDEPFYVVYADDFFRSKIVEPVQLLEIFKKTGRPVVSFGKVEPEEVNRYGIAEVSEYIDDNSFRLKRMVEKPDPKSSPSNLAVAGCSILTPDIFPILAKEKLGVGGEIILTEAIGELAETTHVYGCITEGIWHDAGDKSRYLQAIVDYALVDPKLAPAFKAYLTKRLKQEPKQ